MEPVARELLGEPNKSLSSRHELRYGSRGSLSIDLTKGVWRDHETGEGGGVLALVAREAHGEPKRWLELHGFHIDGAKTNGAAKPQRKIIGTFDYRDLDKRLLFQVVRYEPKDFRQRRPDPEKPDGWNWSTKGAQQVPYKLPEIAKAIENSETIVIVEGETNVELLWKLGIPATCNAGGAGKWSNDLNVYFKNANIIIIPDFDPQKVNPKTKEPMFHDDGRPVLPGQDHALDIARKLTGIAKIVQILDLGQVWPAVKPKNDFVDWHKATRIDAEQFYLIADDAPVWAPDFELSWPYEKLILTLTEWIERQLAELDLLLGKWLATTTRGIINAPTGLGKTMLGIGLAMRMAAGVGFLHWAATRPATVLFVDGEMTARGLKRRIVAELERFQSEHPGKYPEGFHALCHEDIENFQPLNTPTGQQQIERAIEQIGGVDFIFFDNIMSLIAGDMKEEDGWRQTLQWIKALSKRSIGQFWLHHTGHDESHGYGTKTREWQMDIVIHCTRLQRPESDIAFQLTFTKARDRMADNRADFADLVITLVDEQWKAEIISHDKSLKKLQPMAQKFLDALCNSIGSSQITLDNQPATHLELWRKQCVQQGLLDGDKAHSARALFSKYRQQLIAADRIVVNGERVRLVVAPSAYQAQMAF